jgi:hypothetical protein
VVVFLNAFGKLTPFGDANRVRKWIESGVGSQQRDSGIAASSTTTTDNEG